MVAHLDTEVSEAVDAHDDDAALNAFDEIFEEEILDDDEELTEEEPDEGEAEEDEADEDEEQEEPAIAAPVSFNKEEKAVFATMTPEQQQSVAAIETRRNADVQKATTEAAEAKRTARQEAESQVAIIQRNYAAELAQYAQAYEVQEPDYSLLATDPQAFAEQLAYNKQMTAQREQMTQQARQAQANAEALDQQRLEQWEQEQQAILAREIPEWGEPEKRKELVGKLISIGKDLGFSDDALSNVDAMELLALRKISTDREKANAYDKLMAKSMEHARSFKGKPAPKTAQSGAAQPRGSGERKSLSEAKMRLRQTGSDADALAILEKMF